MMWFELLKMLVFPNSQTSLSILDQPDRNRRHTDQKAIPPPNSQSTERRKSFEIDYSFAERDLEAIIQDYNLIKSIAGQVAAEQLIFDNHWLVLDGINASFVLPEGFDLIDLVFLKKFQINLEEQDQRVLMSCENSDLPPETLL
jgi:hypothetical protein